MIALYISWNPFKKLIEIDGGSPESRNKIQASTALQRQIHKAAVEVWQKWAGLPVVPTRDLPIIAREYQDKMGEGFTVDVEPVR